MNKANVVFYSLVFIGNLLIATEWAKYGILEIGIQRPANKRAFLGLFFGISAMFFSIILDKYYEINPYQSSYKVYVIFVVLGVPLVWLLFFRYVLIPKGLFDFNKARTRTVYWALSNYRPGVKNDEEKARNLREFGFAQDALRRFKKAIKLQGRGDLVHRVEKTLQLTDNFCDYYDYYRISCPVCPSPINLPKVRSHNFSGACNMCGSFVTARIEGYKVFLAADLTRSIRSPNKGNWYNVAVAYEEMAWLYRMMNMFDEALEALEKAMDIAEDLLKRSPRTEKYLSLKSLIIFRRAEINHILGNVERAREEYKESLSLDRELKNEEGIETIEYLLNQL